MNHPAVFLIFKIVMVAVLLSMQFFCYRSISRHLKESNGSRILRIGATVPFIMFNLPLIVFLFWIPKIIVASRWLTYVCIYPFYLWHFSLFIVCLVLIVINVPWLFLSGVVWGVRRIRHQRMPIHPRAGTPAPIYDHRRRIFIRRGMTVLAGAALTGSTYGAFKKDRYELSEIPVPVLHLPESFEGFSITLISDIHSSVFMPKEKMEEYARTVNALRSDLITVTGDFVNSQVDEVYPFAEAFEGLRAPHGVYGVLGNHDYYTRNVDVVARHVEDCGIKLLVNAGVAIRKGSETIYLLGSDDIGTSARADAAFDTMLTGMKQDVPKVLMCHRPYFFENAAHRGIGLTLSGHTHGGQIVFGRINDNYISAARLASPYIAGLYSIGAAKMYVSRGIGTVGVPIRINCPPEITKIVLTKA